MTDIVTLVLSSGIMTGIGTAFAFLLRANLAKDKLLAEILKEQGEATRQGARADYAVALALQRIEQKMGLTPSVGVDPQTLPAATGGQS